LLFSKILLFAKLETHSFAKSLGYDLFHALIEIIIMETLKNVFILRNVYVFIERILIFKEIFLIRFMEV